MENWKKIARLVTVVIAIMAIVAGSTPAGGIDTTGAITVPMPDEEEVNPYEYWIDYSEISNCTVGLAFNATWALTDGREISVNEDIEFEVEGVLNQRKHYFIALNNLSSEDHYLIKGCSVYFDPGINMVTGFRAIYSEEFEDLKLWVSINGTKEECFLPRVDEYVGDIKNTTFGWQGQEVYEQCIVSIRAGCKEGDLSWDLKDYTCDNTSYISFTFNGRLPELPDGAGKVLEMPVDRERQDEYVCSLRCWLPPAVDGVGSGKWWGEQKIEFYNPETRKFINANVVGYGPYVPYAVACLSRNAIDAIGAKENETVLYLAFASPEPEQGALGIVGAGNSLAQTLTIPADRNTNGIMDVSKFAQ